ncbi:MAG: helicase-related protein [Dehalococcoidia bacterium]
MRFLLADDPGAGKTIMAGLLIRELMLRGDLERCLIVCPANLGDQWQEELSEKFRLNFDLVGRPEIEASVSNNPFTERSLVISRIDMLKQDDNMARLRAAEDWDLVVVDEAHKMSASYYGNEAKYTARYHLGELLGQKTRHLLLMTATPHRGKEEDFQLFMGLLDADRFEGRAREGTREVDVADLMRRMLKEELVDFDGKPLFPERRAYTVNYELSNEEALLYEEVTRYVSEEMNNAEKLAAEAGGDRRRTVVGFALTILQRRLASSPAAIHESLKRRVKRLERKLEEAHQAKRAAEFVDDRVDFGIDIRGSATAEDLEDDLDEESESEAQEIVDLASASTTVVELEKEIGSLRRLALMAERVRQSKVDRKWDKLRDVLENPEMFDMQGGRRKLVIFTEHRDTLNYLVERIGGLLGRPEAVVQIHGSLLREERRKAQARFVNEADALVLVATDAAGEGVNLQRAHLMVNYDLPWNPNRIEQRFGRIHRFGQRETCHLWNLVAHQTREGAVYHRLFEKLEEERSALGGKVFDVLGRVFTEVALRDLMLEAIRYNTTDEARAYLQQKIDSTWDKDFLHRLIDERALDTTTINAAKLRELKDEMERAEARRLVPHFIESFFVDAFTLLGGNISKREPGRYQVTHVPSDLRRRDRVIGRGDPVLKTYERICFDKAHVSVDGKPPAGLVAPGHALLDAVVDVLLERHRDVLRRGAILVDEADEASEPRVLFSIESDVTDGRLTREGSRRVISKRVDYVEVDARGEAVSAGAAPYLDYRPLEDPESAAANDVLTSAWLASELEELATEHGITEVVDKHLQEVRADREALVLKTAAAVKARLTGEIQYWDQRAEDLRLQEETGKTPRLNSANARRRCDELEERLERRTNELKLERDVAAQPPIVHGGALVVPVSLLRLVSPDRDVEAETSETRHVEAVAMAHVMATEAAADRHPRDVSAQNRGWDIESREADGALRFIEVKGRKVGADTVCVTKNETLTCLNKRDRYYLAIAWVNGDEVVDYLLAPDPLRGDWAFAMTSMNLDVSKLRPLGTKEGSFQEFDLLCAAALRIDGYRYAADRGRAESGDAVEYYWNSGKGRETDDPVEQLVMFFFQQRGFRWGDDMPTGANLRRWRELFLATADVNPPDEYRTGLDGDSMWTRSWETKYVPHLPALKRAIADRLGRDATLDEGLVLLETA